MEEKSKNNFNLEEVCSTFQNVLPQEAKKYAHQLTKNWKVDELERVLVTLEKSPDQETFNLSLLLAGVLHDRKRIMAGLFHHARSARRAALFGLRSLTAEDLKQVVFEVEPVTRQKVLHLVRNRKGVKRWGAPLVEELAREMLERFGDIHLLPFVREEGKLQELMERAKLRRLQNLDHPAVWKRRVPQQLFRLFANELKQKLVTHQRRGRFYLDGQTREVGLRLFPLCQKEMTQLLEEVGNQLDPFEFFSKRFSRRRQDIFLQFLTASWNSSSDPHSSGLERLSVTQLIQVWQFWKKEAAASSSATSATSALMNNILKPLNALPSFRKWNLFLDALTKEEGDLFELFKDVKSGDLLVLPHAVRQKVASLELEKKPGPTEEPLSERDKLLLLRNLDISVSRSQIEKICSSSDPNIRSEAYKSLITSAMLSKDTEQISELLLKKMKNEIDPVKCQVVRFLNQKLTYPLYSNLSNLMTLIEPMFKSLDRSRQLLSEINALMLEILKVMKGSQPHVDFCLNILQLTFKQQEISIPPNHIDQFLGLVKTDLISLLESGQFDDLKTKIQMFFDAEKQRKGQSGFPSPALQEFLQMMVDSLKKIQEGSFSPSPSLSTMIELYVASCPKKEALQRAKKILALDASAITIPAVQRIAFQHQDLLDEHLSSDDPPSFKQGLFAQPTNKSCQSFDPTLVTFYSKSLTSKKRAQLSKILLQTLKNAEPREFRRYICALSSLQIGEPDDSIKEFLNETAGSDDQILAHAAGSASNFLDLNPSVESLLQNLSSSNVKLSCSLVAKQLNPKTRETLVKFLLDDGFTKRQITVQKEVIRHFTSSLPATQRSEVLSKIWATPPHKDVKIAILDQIKQLVMKHTDVPFVWKILEDASKDQEASVVATLFGFKVDQLGPKECARIAQLQLQVLDHPDPKAKHTGWTSIQPDLGIHKEIAERAAKILCDYSEGSPVFTSMAGSVSSQFVVCVNASKPPSIDLLCGTVKKILSEMKPAEVDNGPHDQTPRTIINQIISFLTSHSNIFETVLPLILQHDPTFWDSVRSLPISLLTDQSNVNITQFLKTAVALARLCKGIPEEWTIASLIAKIEEVGWRIRHLELNWEKLNQLDDPLMIILILTLNSHNESEEKAPEANNYIRKMRTHPHPVVRYLATNQPIKF